VSFRALSITRDARIVLPKAYRQEISEEVDFEMNGNHVIDLLTSARDTVEPQCRCRTELGVKPGFKFIHIEKPPTSLRVL
jgi:cell division protein FtsB